MLVNSKKPVLLFLFSMTLLLCNAQKLSLHKFGEVWQDSIQWNSFSAFPAKVKLAILVGDPTTNSPFIVRVKVPANEKILPHKHPEDRIYTVISGVFYIGIGEHYEAEKLRAYPQGSVIVLPGNTPHFHWAKSGEYVTQVYAIGPLGMEYINPQNDTRIN